MLTVSVPRSDVAVCPFPFPVVRPRRRAARSRRRFKLRYWIIVLRTALAGVLFAACAFGAYCLLVWAAGGGQ